MHIQCPHCRSSIECAADSDLHAVACPTCGSSFSLLSDDTITRQPSEPRRLSHFELIERIGIGAFGEVWKARDTTLERHVAVKIPRRGELDERNAEQFLREAKAAATLSHPNIVAIHEIGSESGQLFIVSDLIDGVTLADWLTAHRPSPKQSLELCVKIAEALHHAHERGVIHRDLKPSNIILDAQCVPYIMDFGLAKREASEVTMTVDGRVLGTPAYMSPEQAEGQAHRADRRSDVYSLGVILFELLTGERPFRGTTAMLVHQVIHEQAPSPRLMNDRISRDLETVTLKCLEKDPARRYQSAEQLRDDLQRFLDGRPVLARPVGALGRVWRWYRRHPDASIMAAGGLETLCALLFILWCLTGMAIYLLGLHPTPNPAWATIQLALLLVSYYLPMLWAGIATLNGRIAGLWTGAILSLVGALFTGLGLTGCLFDEGTYGDVQVRMPLFVLLIILTVLSLALHTVAIISHYASQGRLATD